MNRHVLLETAESAAREAGDFLRTEWQEPRHLEKKGFRDWVTDADYASQQIVTDLIQQRHPTHGFQTEEADGELPTTGDVIWLVDPVDGTTNFSRQQPNFTITLAAVADGDVQAGVVYEPMRDEMFSAVSGGGSTLNGEGISVSDRDALERSVVALDWAHAPAQRQRSLDALGRYAHEVRTIRALGSAALALAWVAVGRLDAYLNPGLQPWDLAAGALLVREAGGRISDWNGQAWTPPVFPPAGLATNGRIHDQLLALIAV
ncbi:MAG: inositol monophosphatase family protein [Candidatus Promineifilaceae bacterium]|nr:inositol monophosphatase family protein [Candidatus Promineifilaceae bacterium]